MILTYYECISKSVNHSSAYYYNIQEGKISFCGLFVLGHKRFGNKR